MIEQHHVLTQRAAHAINRLFELQLQLRGRVLLPKDAADGVFRHAVRVGEQAKEQIARHLSLPVRARYGSFPDHHLDSAECFEGKSGRRKGNGNGLSAQAAAPGGNILLKLNDSLK